MKSRKPYTEVMKADTISGIIALFFGDNRVIIDTTKETTNGRCGSKLKISYDGNTHFGYHDIRKIAARLCSVY
ncbi:hypothetical protein [Planococcus halotolerans]|uniref:hypothetical protein n=1 Tax=Planococcus halotolerans TaxID=2233542 RepID=UPI0010582A39|nr:hypothetical protein [Planococcus halotolerans]